MRPGLTAQTRRDLLFACSAGCTALALGGCKALSDTGSRFAEHDSDGAPLPGGTDCAVEPGTAAEGGVEIPLADYPGLETPGGSAIIAIAESLLYVVIACIEADCWIALWSTCTHGACPVQWKPESRHAWCGCHGSVFAPDGTVLQGPATEPLTTFPVGRRGDSLWVHRPL